ncbi:hypothetical protein H6B07_01450 [Mediterraneibacter glycyrrhizinilyticus]|uniref:hypothetical protein n=1 Tax=Mediterraneibacter glycyrrhizinilyticus TaxID=342942 RepID=UPI0019620DCF|nr:hypothetical protein [Mediterraneibacter glycyrrhizinilyticus]MBM6801341.1 hypothetical protein [Mediterraneibacter glycyrrhizinilyticus]MDM8123985.1 hypothetical protein [Mediterraneibacter glycyrrhizinilyticus]
MAGVPYEVQECIQLINEISRELDAVEAELPLAAEGVKCDRLRRELRECSSRYRAVGDVLYRIG